MEGDAWETLAHRRTASIRVERSEFIAIAFPMPDEETFASELDSAQKEYFDATHHCWAWRLFSGGSPRSRSSDAGEPAGTAGKPILSAIEGEDLFDSGIIVVRYFGGVKLGSGGLGRAYRNAAREALSGARREAKFLYERFEVFVPFASVSALYRMIAPPDIVLLSETYGEENVFTLEVRRSAAGRIAQELGERRLRFRRLP